MTNVPFLCLNRSYLDGTGYVHNFKKITSMTPKTIKYITISFIKYMHGENTPKCTAPKNFTRYVLLLISLLYNITMHDTHQAHNKSPLKKLRFLSFSMPLCLRFPGDLAFTPHIIEYIYSNTKAPKFSHNFKISTSTTFHFSPHITGSNIRILPNGYLTDWEPPAAIKKRGFWSILNLSVHPHCRAQTRDINRHRDLREIPP